MTTSSHLDKGQIQGHGEPNMRQMSSVARDLSRTEKGEIRLLVEIHTPWQGPTVYVCSFEALLRQIKGKENAVRRMESSLY